mgnify:CR=1 FL=1
MKKTKEHAFIVVWCSDGLEWVEDISNHDQKAMWSTLKGEPPKSISDKLKAAIFRARLNTQRSYEIYSITAIDGIMKSDIVEMFNLDPQGAAEIIRDKGYKIFADRVTKEKVIT